MAATIPDPELTISEAVNGSGVIIHFLQGSEAGGDAVLESFVDKLVAASQKARHLDPDAFAAVEAEIAMQQRFRAQRGDRGA